MERANLTHLDGNRGSSALSQETVPKTVQSLSVLAIFYRHPVAAVVAVGLICE